MNLHIIYETKGKHNEKVAKTIGNALNIPVSNVADQPVLTNIDILFVVGGWYDGSSNGELLNYIKYLKSNAVKRAALITPTHHYDNRQTEVHTMLTQKGIDVIGERVCISSFLFIQLGHPNKGDLTNAINFVKSILGISIYD